jgi:hypothetical protein
MTTKSNWPEYVEWRRRAKGAGNSTTTPLGVVDGSSPYYTINPSNGGSIFIQPAAGQTNQTTFSYTGTSPPTLYAIASAPYLTVPAGTTIRINGSAWSKNSFGAALVRINKANAIEGQSTLAFNWRTVTGSGSDPFFAMGVQGALGSVISSAANRLVSVYAQGPGFIRVSSLFTSTLLPSASPVINAEGPYGSDAATSDTANSAWCWIFWRSSDGSTSTSSEVNLSSDGTGGQAVSTVATGHMFVAPGALVVASPQRMNFRVSNTMSSASITEASYDWILGTTTAYTVGTTYDIAQIILLSRFPTSLDMALMMQGMDPTDMGLSPLTTDFVGHFGSAAQLAATTGKTIVYGGASIPSGNWHTSGGPTMIRKLGSVNPTRTVNIVSGAVL